MADNKYNKCRLALTFRRMHRLCDCLWFDGSQNGVAIARKTSRETSSTYCQQYAMMVVNLKLHKIFIIIIIIIIAFSTRERCDEANREIECIELYSGTR